MVGSLSEKAVQTIRRGLVVVLVVVGKEDSASREPTWPRGIRARFYSACMNRRPQETEGVLLLALVGFVADLEDKCLCPVANLSPPEPVYGFQ